MISWQSIFFFLIIPLIAWAFGERRRAVFLSFINIVFAAIWLQQGAILILSSATLAYISAKQMRSSRSGWWLAMGLVVTIGPLVFLRWPLETSEISRLRTLWVSASFAFYSLQSCGALLDIYWRRADAPQSLTRWLAFGLFFPSLIAGPIARWKELGADIDAPIPFQKSHGREALLLLAQGLFKKMVLAAPLFFFLDRYFADPLKHGWITAIAMAFFLRYAIWAEIGSHTDWARAGAKLLGYGLPVNFNYPFQTLRLAEFWRRWHMSLSSWLQDYIFTPMALGRLRRIMPPRLAMVVALLVAFSALGLWHGLTISFLFMGLFKGLGVLTSEWSWKKAERGGGFPFFLYRATVAPLLIFVFLVLPTLLIRMDLSIFQSIFTRPDYGFSTSWPRLTEVYDADSIVHRSFAPYLALALGYELLLWANRKRQSFVNDVDNRGAWDFFALTQWQQSLILLVGFLLFLIFAEFDASLGFSYVSH